VPGAAGIPARGEEVSESPRAVAAQQPVEHEVDERDDSPENAVDEPGECEPRKCRRRGCGVDLEGGAGGQEAAVATLP